MVTGLGPLLASSADVCRLAILAFMDRRKRTPILLQGNMLYDYICYILGVEGRSPFPSGEFRVGEFLT